MERNWIRKRRHSPNELDSAIERTRRPLKHDLGVNPAGVEAIGDLRDRVLQLQARIRELQVGLDGESQQQSARLIQYRESDVEAT